MKAFEEFKNLIRLAAPLIAAQLAMTSIGFVDSVMAGRVSAVDLAAVSLGASLWMPVFVTMSGVLMSVTPFVAQHAGAARFSEVPKVSHQGIYLSLILGVIGFLLVRYAYLILNIMNIEQELFIKSRDYLRAVSWGIPFVLFYQALKSYCEGLGHTKPIMIISFIGLGLNIPVNYVLIYGKLGFEPMGGVGCGWASAWVMFVLAAGMAYTVLTSKTYEHVRLFRFKRPPKLSELKELSGVGIPIGVSIFIEVSIFSVISLMVAPYGSTVVAGHQIALNFASLIFMVPLGISMALTVRTGNYIGAEKPADARLAAYTGIGATLLFAVFTSAFIMLFPDSIAGFYSSDRPVVNVASSLLIFAALFQFSDAVQVSSAGALRGYKDTKVPMLLTAVAYWVISLPLGYILAETHLIVRPQGAAGYWISLVAGLSVAAVLMSVRLRSVSKRFAVA